MTDEPRPSSLADGPPAEPHDAALRHAQEARLREAWATPTGWRYWSAVNNKHVGLWYTVAALGFLVFGGVLALLIRVQLATPDSDFMSPELYNQVFTLHGSVMMFLFAVPIVEAVSILVLPEMMAARDLPFPRLSAYGFWCFLLGGVFVSGSIFFGAAPQGGWFMYPPLTTSGQPGIGADIWLLGLSFIEVASIAAAVELIVGVLKCRPPGMRIHLMPLYAWYVLVVGVMILFAFPPLIVGDVLLELERLLDWPFFDAARGGDPLLWQHLFWIFGHPEVYIVFLPAMALTAMIVPTFARRPIVGYKWVVLAAIGIGFISFGLWVHHMYTTGLPALSLGFFSAASEAVAIPTGVQIFCFIATLLAGRVVRSVPLLFVLGGLAIFVLGGLTGVMVALVPFDLQAHDTYFVVGHLHYVLIGGTIFPILGALYYYFPRTFGRQLSPKLGRVAFWTLFVGFHVTFLPMHLTGLRGMPRRIFNYPAGVGFDALNLVSSVGAFVLAAGFLVLIFDVVRPRRRQPVAERNPWNAGTLEWLTPIPSEAWGVRSVPDVHTRYPLWEQPDLVRQVDEGRGYLADTREGLRETLVTTPLDANPTQCLRVPGPTWIAMFAAFGTGGAFIFATFHMWWAAAASGLFALGAMLRWLWTGTARIPTHEEKDVGGGVVLPTYRSGPDSVGWWAMGITMIGDTAAFLALLFGYGFYWTVHAGFPPTEFGSVGVLWPGVALGLVLGAWGSTVLARRLNRSGRGPQVVGALVLGLGLAVGGGAAALAGPWFGDMDPTAHVYPAIVWTLVIWLALHVALGALMQGYCIARRLAGHLDDRHDIDLVNVTLYWHFVAVTAAVALAVVAAVPRVA